ncbi:MAG TPA: hypothetical protein VEB68_12570 [Croceibacterium sp.]|nr:hypothetical protein [Croceibacterium sp.]
MQIMKPGAQLAIAALSVALALTVAAAPARAQATRTWVSGVGDDANPCSRTAPCKTFAGAISKTATGGEINCLDPGGFGGLTIIKSISVICDYSEGGVLSAGAGVNGFVINLPAATDTVFLSGLDFNGAGSAQNGIRIVSGGIVHVQNTVIRNYRAANGLGISVQPAGTLKLTVLNSTISDNGVAGAPGTGGGILVQPTGAGGSARVALDNVTLANNGNNAFHVNTTVNTSAAGVSVEIHDSHITGSTNGIHLFKPVSGSVPVAMITDTHVFNNTGQGIIGNGASVRMRVAGTTITGNGVGINPGGASVINDLGGNVLAGNTNNGTFQLADGRERSRRTNPPHVQYSTAPGGA